MELQIPEAIPEQGEVALEGIDFISSGDQYLTFTLGEENYAVDILSVKEIRGWEPPTAIPHSASYVKGVVNLRGIIVPIIDLRNRFRVGELVYDPTTVVIVLSTVVDGRDRMMGFVVDGVSDVLNVEEHEVNTPPAFGGYVPADFIKGMVNVQRSVVTLLKVDMLMALDDGGEN